MKTTDDITRFCRKAVSDVCYYDLKRDRKQIMDLVHGGAVPPEVLFELTVRTLQCVDGRLKQFSDEEKEIYDAVRGDNI